MGFYSSTVRKRASGRLHLRSPRHVNLTRNAQIGKFAACGDYNCALPFDEQTRSRFPQSTTQHSPRRLVPTNREFSPCRSAMTSCSILDLLRSGQSRCRAAYRSSPRRATGVTKVFISCYPIASATAASRADRFWTVTTCRGRSITDLWPGMTSGLPVILPQRVGGLPNGTVSQLAALAGGRI